MPEGVKALARMPVPVTMPMPLSGISGNAGVVGGSGALGIGAAAGGVGGGTMSVLQNALQRVQAKVADENASLEDNMSISASQRYSIMQKLMRNGDDAEVILYVSFLFVFCNCDTKSTCSQAHHKPRPRTSKPGNTRRSR